MTVRIDQAYIAEVIARELDDVAIVVSTRPTRDHVPSAADIALCAGVDIHPRLIRRPPPNNKTGESP